jgi:hypothetical protein
MQQLSGHSTIDSAFTIPRFPYYFGAYTSVRYWIETKFVYGQRAITQIYDPATMAWFKPKPGSYFDFVFLLVENDQNALNLGLLKIVELNVSNMSDEDLATLHLKYILDEHQKTRLISAINDRHAERAGKELFQKINNQGASHE